MNITEVKSPATKSTEEIQANILHWNKPRHKILAQFKNRAELWNEIKRNTETM